MKVRAQQWDMRTPAIFLALALVLAGSGCSSRNRESRAAPPSPGRIITAEDIARWNVSDALGVIERAGGYSTSAGTGTAIRQRRGRSSITNATSDRPLVLLDNAMLSDNAVLRQIRADQIDRVEILAPGDATARYGTGAAAGAILIFTRSR